MEGKEEDVRLGANKYSERQPIGTAAQGSEDKDYKEPPPAPLFEPGELKSWSFYRAGIAEFMATFLFLYVTILTVMGYSGATSKCASVGIQGIAWSFGGMIFALVYCTAGISGINPARSLGAAIIYNREHAWSDHWIFWVGPFIGAALAAVYHQVVIRAIPFKTKS
ncbi:unnamed protein product [Triticum turgidum subsp. durum]|uniref:Aquaporin n=1 Tax=Triticum turgidum subsp. durum TaxID=4567 RepID=A0A9R1RBI7_TRITD|nr:unnamed protein product [Triticum turgidum subsp. durum]